MAELKTKATTASVDAYIATAGSNARRADCRTLVALCREATNEPPTMWGPSIVGFGSYHYKYASGHEGHSCLVGFSSRKSDLTLYLMPGFESRGALLRRLGPHRTGKACLYVKRLSNVDLSVLGTLIRVSATEMRRRATRSPAAPKRSAGVPPLFKKLNLTTQGTIHVLNSPRAFDAQLAALQGVTVRRYLRGTTTFAIAFAITKAELDSASTLLAKAAEGDAVVWVAYPKGTSKKYTCEFNRDTGWTALGKAGFEPVRQVALDDDWSALRFRRAEHIKTLTRAAKRATSDAGKARARVPKAKRVSR